MAEESWPSRREMETAGMRTGHGLRLSVRYKILKVRMTFVTRSCGSVSMARPSLPTNLVMMI